MAGYGGEWSKALTGEVKIVLVRRRAPESPRRHLPVTASKYKDSYDDMHDIIEAFRRAQDEVVVNDGVGPMPMEVGLVTPKGKGKNMGKCRDQRETGKDLQIMGRGKGDKDQKMDVE